MAWWRAVREVFCHEWPLLQRHRKRAIEAHGLFAQHRLDDPAEARRPLPQGDLALSLKAPVAFKSRPFSWA